MLLAAAINTATGVWCVTSLNEEYKLFSLAFFVPAACSLALCLSKRGTRASRTAGALVLFLGVLKTIAAVALALLALAAGQSHHMLAKLGAVAYGALGALLAIGALSDACAGCPAACAAKRGLRLVENGDMGVEF